MATSPSPLLQKPLYVFDLPEELLATLTLKALAKSPSHHLEEQRTQRPKQETKAEPGDASPAKAASCSLCGLTFADVQEQRNHIRSDLHAFNLKQKQRGFKAVNEADFERLIGDLDESISGSETSESDEDEDENESRPAQGKSNLNSLLERQARITTDDNDDDEATGKKPKRGAGKPPLLWFSSSVLPQNTSLGVYRAILPLQQQGDDPQVAQYVRQMQLAPAKARNSDSKAQDGGVMLPSTNLGPHYFLCMIGGGHFAAMIIALTPKTGKGQSGGLERSATVIAHKTFHRYTTRRKQGGAQSANDNSKGNAHSAGSSLRRYNEVALTNEVRELLTQWKSMIDSADLIFVRATGNTNRQTLFGPYEGQVLRHNDARNRGFPFSTRRATQAELMRCFVELTRVKVSEVDEAALAAAAAEAERKAQEERSRAASQKKKAVEKAAKSKEEEAAELHTSQIIPLIRRSKVPGLLSYLSSNNIPSTFEFFPPDAQQHHHAPTSLHLAASVNSAVVVTALLQKVGADPTTPNGDGKTPFELAGDRATRDAFRVARKELGEDRWDWQAALVPSALSKAEAEKRATREKEEEAAEANAESARRKAETERLRAESQRDEAARTEKRLGKGKTLNALPEKTAADRREEEARGMTPEMRQRLERERRARAAEERLKRLQQGG